MRSVHGFQDTQVPSLTKPGTDHGIHGTMVSYIRGHTGTSAAMRDTTPWGGGAT